VRRVLPGLNLDPSSFELGAGFLTRAEKRGRPTLLPLRSTSAILVYSGACSTDAPPTDGLDVRAQNALATLPEALQGGCDHLVVAWTIMSSCVAYCAAFAVLDAKAGRSLNLLAVSWSPSDTWELPTADPSRPQAEALSQYLHDLASLIARRQSEPDFDATIDRLSGVVEELLAYAGGEGQDLSNRPCQLASDAEWELWSQRYEEATRDEWRRATGQPRLTQPATLSPTSSGALARVRVFLSYARPDAASLALPVREALRSCGATVWFDQEQDLDAAWLNAGLAAAIAACDAYVMCASDEFIERASYATQEVAWALSHRPSFRPLRVATVARPGTLVPAVVAAWPQVELRDQNPILLGRQLGAALNSRAAIPPPPQPAALPRKRIPALPPEADLEAMRTRVRHLRRFDEIPGETVSALIGGQEIPGLQRLATLVRNCGEGLGWPGRLDDIDEWPRDSAVKDLRLRLATTRALAGTRWPLSNDLDDTDDVKSSVQFLAEHLPPIMRWPDVPGWGDNERRFALRYHAGALRWLERLLARGLYGGLLDVPGRDRKKWAGELTSRRVECYDALIDLRLRGVLSWKAEPPTWDRFFRTWHTLLTRHQSSWQNTVPPSLRLLLAGNAGDIAAVGAQTSWCAAHHGSHWEQRFMLRNTSSSGCISVFTDATTGSTPLHNETAVRLGLARTESGTWVVSVSWAGQDAVVPSDGGSVSGNAPKDLLQAMSFLND
jgi:hypothetical protein